MDDLQVWGHRSSFQVSAIGDQLSGARLSWVAILLWVVGVALVGVGLAGVVFPALPGAVLIFAGLLLAAWANDFQHVGLAALVLIGIIGALSYGIDFVAAALGAQRGGATPRAVAGAALGTLLGLPLGLPGVIFGPLVGAIAGELTAHRDYRRAGKVGLAAWIGFLIGTAVKIAFAFSMIAIFIVAFLWD
jgi:uncharacterized protein YqgC (DUF456 family)